MLLGRHGGHDLRPQAFSQLCLHLGTGLGLGIVLHLLLGRDQVLGTAALLLELDAVLHVLVLEQHPEELDQMEQEEQEHRNNNNDQEAGAGLQVVKHLTNTCHAEGILTDDLRLMDGQGVSRGVVITFGGEDQVAAAVVNFVDSMGIEHALAVDDGPISDDVTLAQLAGILDTGIEDQVAGQQCGVHRLGLDGEHPDTKDAGHAVAGGRNIGHVGTDSRQSDSQHQDDVHDRVQDAFSSAFLFDDLDLFVFFLRLRQDLSRLFLLEFHGDSPFLSFHSI